VDVLETTEHTLRYNEDLDKLAGDGIRTFRCCIPWHRVEQSEGAYDWSWLDLYMTAIRERGLNPIVDPLHHTSFPEWLKDGFADRRFSDSYVGFLRAFAQRYPWVTSYTIINEPLVTAWFCGHCGVWQPRLTGHENFVPMILAVCRTICLASEMLTALVPGVRFVHVDSCEKHYALDEASLPHALFENERRFLVVDLVLGRLDDAHPLRSYLKRHGATDAELNWFCQHPAHIDVLGLDYYSHSELAWLQGGAVRETRHPVQGFAAVGLEYARRYGLPVMLSETNLRGEVADRITWLKYMTLECERLVQTLEPLGVPFVGFCWYPYLDSTDWGSLVCEARRDIDPQGVWSLAPDFSRQRTELSRLYARLAAHQFSAADLPAYPFSDDVLENRMMRNFLPHMDWMALPESPPGTHRLTA
jgi:hypothetical protein